MLFRASLQRNSPDLNTAIVCNCQDELAIKWGVLTWCSAPLQVQ